MASRSKFGSLPEDNETGESFQRFAWQTCEGLAEDSEKLSIKEDAVAKVEIHAANLIRIFQEQADDQPTDSNDVIMSILSNLISIWDEHRSFEMLVGVAGATGAGKSSMLNATLGLREMLPSGQEGAATAVPCKVSWNYDDRPGCEFIAEIYFQSKEEVIKNLEILIEAFISRDNPDESSFKSASERDENLEQVRSEIQKGMEKIRSVWKIEEEQVEEIITRAWPDDNTLKANLLFDSNPAVGELLESPVKTIHGSTSEELASLIKPYLDSTEASHGLGIDFAAWPLVKEVKLFLRSEILKGGICLVDLPGQGEMEESRAEVARKYQDKLDVTMIVAPVYRAADERVAQELLSKFNSIQMQMDGRFTKERFSVILSKTDSIEVDTYLKSYSKDKDVQRLQSAYQIAQQGKKNRPCNRRQRKLQSRAKSLLRVFEKTCKKNVYIKKEEAESKPSMRKWEKEKLWREKSVKYNTSVTEKALAKALLRKIKSWEQHTVKKNKLADLELVRLRHALSHWAISNRNRHVGQRIEQSFQREQKGSTRGSSLPVDDTRGVTVLGISSTAFWQLEDQKRAKIGFANESFTGIPRVRQWIHRAISSSRGKHLVLILNKYLVAFNKLQSWAKEQKGPDSGISKAEIEYQLSKSHRRCLKNLESVFEELFEAIEDLNPLDNSDPIKIKFKRESAHIVENWSLKHPKISRKDKICWSTYRAILSREGYWRHPKGIEYTWICDLATPLLINLEENWKGVSKNSVFELWEKAGKKIWRIWMQYCKFLSDSLGKTDRGLQKRLIEISPQLTAIGNSLCSQMISLLDNFAKEVNGVHSLIIPSTKKALRPLFKQALQYQGHRSHASRQEYLASNVPQRCELLVSSLSHDIRESFCQSLDEVKDSSNNIAREAIGEVKTQIDFGLSDNGRSASELKGNCLGILRLWQESPDEDLEHILKQDVAIPEEVTIEHMTELGKADGSSSNHGPIAQTDSDESDSDSAKSDDEKNQDEKMWLGGDVSIEDLEMELKDLEKLRKKG
ncbi:unnamed protein product [Clonostachys rosea]|uniref:Dynamin N-terminal domain-containing protein n=1 Tax=Bionectria ochroleuca TaxID=29856 RepID=A0ABY6V2L3_BIOOC|nr:unnamed protein product [Clonostachys rosea]